MPNTRTSEYPFDSFRPAQPLCHRLLWRSPGPDTAPGQPGEKRGGVQCLLLSLAHMRAIPDVDAFLPASL